MQLVHMYTNMAAGQNRDIKTIATAESVSWLNVVLADTVEGFRQLSSNAECFESGRKCGLVLALFARWADSACVVAVSANTSMLTFSMLNILLTLLSNFSSFSTFWKHALQMLLEGRPSPLLRPTLWKSSLTQASTDGEVFRCRQLCELLTELLQRDTSLR